MHGHLEAFANGDRDHRVAGDRVADDHPVSIGLAEETAEAGQIAQAHQVRVGDGNDTELGFRRQPEFHESPAQPITVGARVLHDDAKSTQGDQMLVHGGSRFSQPSCQFADADRFRGA
ncbi:hypothetical protein D3C87_1694500 [compost metagenome]